ncbi:MAG: hypothetical protein J2P27_04765 [Actinobacteria bacterium]|nr:hypothetical protein [Actinomycetota bacterium]
MNAGRNRPAGRKKWHAAVAIVALVLVGTGCSQKPGLGQDFLSTSGHRDYLAPFRPADFHHSTVITNKYFPLVVGATWSWKGEYRGLPYTQKDQVLTGTRRIDGVVTQPVIDQDYVQGKIIAGSIDYYAQDDQGNVWYLGEATVHYVKGQLTDHADSWIAGKDGALPGIFMPAHPQTGRKRFQQEFAPDVAADVENIVTVSKSVCEPMRCYAQVVQANETTVLNPGVLSAKYYAPGVGLIGEDTLSGDTYSYGLTSFTWPGTAPIGGTS